MVRAVVAKLLSDAHVESAEPVKSPLRIFSPHIFRSHTLPLLALTRTILFTTV